MRAEPATRMAPSTAFRDVVARAASPLRRGTDERCDMCSEPLGGEHRHVVDTDSGELMCTCRACSLLFDRDAAGGGHYKLVPDRRRRLDVDLDAPLWKRLGVPVGLAFFVPGEPGADVRAVFPSPAGPTESSVDAADWNEAVSTVAEFGDVEPHVEAVLVHRLREARECWVVPIDDCYRLVGVFRRHWKGMSGGDEIWDELANFFDDLRAKARIGGG